jgi:hypothetical protein
VGAEKFHKILARVGLRSPALAYLGCSAAYQIKLITVLAKKAKLLKELQLADILGDGIGWVC